MKTFLQCVCLLLVVPFLAGSCTQEFKYPGNMLWVIPDGALSYFYFQPNSYWVYENDKTGQLDTQVIVSANRKLYKQDEQQGHEWAGVKMKSSFEKITIEHNAVWGNCPDSCCWLQTGKNGYFSSWNYPFVVGERGVTPFGGKDSSVYTVTDIYDSLQLNGGMFYKVIKINTTNSRFILGKDINTFWAKGVGIVRVENLTDSETWNLVDYRIEK